MLQGLHPILNKERSVKYEPTNDFFFIVLELKNRFHTRAGHNYFALSVQIHVKLFERLFDHYKGLY